jgi:hypothetical protein
MLTVTLTSYNMGGNANESDYDDWVSYVTKRVYVHIDAAPFMNGPSHDIVHSEDPEIRALMQQDLAELWQEWLARRARRASRP